MINQNQSTNLSSGLIRQWAEQWDLDPNAHCDQLLYVAAKAFTYGIKQERDMWIDAVNKRNAKRNTKIHQ